MSANGLFVLTRGGLTGISTNFPEQNNAFVPNAPLSGRLRLSRDGSTITASYLENGAWVPMLTGASTPTPVPRPSPRLARTHDVEVTWLVTLDGVAIGDCSPTGARATWGLERAGFVLEDDDGAHVAYAFARRRS